jgi:hypothetical protein
MRRAGWSLRLPVSAAACGAFAGPLVLDVDDRQPQQLDDRVVAREVPAGFGHFPELVVQRLDGVGGVEQFSHWRGEGQERDEPVPGVLPDLDGLRVLLAERGAGERSAG